MSAPGVPTPAAAPWSAPPADSPAAVGLKNGGLSEMTTDIIYPASRQIDGEFTGGRQLEFRWRSDSSRHWLPRESRLHVKYEFKFGETSSTGSGDGGNCLIDIGKKAPKNRLDGTGVEPNANVGFTAAPNASLFDQARYLMNSVSVENQPHYYTTAAAQLLTKVDIAGPDTMGSGMLNSKRLDFGKQLSESTLAGGLRWQDAIKNVADQGAIDDAVHVDVGDVPNYYDGTFPITDGTKVTVDGANAINVSADGKAATLTVAGGAAAMKLETGMRIENFRDIVPAIGGTDGGASVSDFLHYQHSHLYVEETAVANVYNLFTKQNPVTQTVHTPFVTFGKTGAITAFTFDTGQGSMESLTPRDLLTSFVQDRPFMRGSGAVNPKAEILQMGYDVKKGVVYCEVSEPMFLATHQHPYAIASSDHQMYLQISSNWQQDLLYCCDYSYGCTANNGTIISPMPEGASDVIKMGQIYCSVKAVEYHAAFISPMVPSIPPSIGIKYSGMAIRQILLNSSTVSEQVIVPPSCRAVYLFLRQRYHHVCACTEELGRGGVDYNEIVTNLIATGAADETAAGALKNKTGQKDPRLQGRCIPHNLQTLKLGTADGWIQPDELGVAGQQGNKAWKNGLPDAAGVAPVDDPAAAEVGTVTWNKYADKTTKSQPVPGVTVPTIDTLEAQATTHWTDLQVQLGAAMAPKQPYSNLNPGRGAVSRMWTDTINAMGKPMGLRAGNMNLSQYCGWENENGPSGPRNGSRGLVTILRILNPPNSLTNVLQIRGQLADKLGYEGDPLGNVTNESQLELVVATVFDNLLTVNWAPPAEIPIKTMVAPIV